MQTGIVKWFCEPKGFGVITLEDGAECFVHYSAIAGQGFKSLAEGERVELDAAIGPKGLCATLVLRSVAETN